jgi:hypothetical protein
MRSRSSQKIISALVSLIPASLLFYAVLDLTWRFRLVSVHGSYTHGGPTAGVNWFGLELPTWFWFVWVGSLFFMCWVVSFHLTKSAIAKSNA